MTAQVIPARTTGTVQTEWTDSTAVVHQAFKEHNVKTGSSKIPFLHYIEIPKQQKALSNV